jgi:hypothetical protein
MAAEAGNVGEYAAEINDREKEFRPPMTRFPWVAEDRRTVLSISDIGEIRG